MSATLARAEVLRVVDDRAIIRSVDQGCGRCQEPGGCGGFQAQASSGRVFDVDNRIGARVGDLVEISIESGVVLRLAALAYLLPLVGLIGGAVLGSEYTAGPAGAAVGAVAGYFLARYLIRRQDNREPAVVRVCGHCREKL